MKRLAILIVLSAAGLFAQASGVGQLGCNAAPVTGTGWTTATSVNTTQTLGTNIAGASVLVTLDQGSTLTVGAVQFQGDPGDGNVVNLAAWQVVDPTSGTYAQISQPYTLVASTNKQFLVFMSGYYKLALKLTTAITGTATVTPYTTLVCYQPYTPPTPTNITQFGSNAVTTGTGAGGSGIPRVTISNDSSLAANQSMNVAQWNGQTASQAANGVPLVGIAGHADATVDGTQSTPASQALSNILLPTSSSTGGLSIFDNSGTSVTSVVSVKSSAGALYGWYLGNANTINCYLQIFNTASGSVTLGTTAPVMSLLIPATSTSPGAANLTLTIPISFGTAISVASTTTATGATTTGCGQTVNLWYQ